MLRGLHLQPWLWSSHGWEKHFQFSNPAVNDVNSVYKETCPLAWHGGGEREGAYISGWLVEARNSL